jgi:hypothetical protein
MGQNNPSKIWLKHEDNTAREDRLARLDWIADLMPDVDYLSFPGGWMSKYLFEEARYCFVYGQFFATIVLGLSYIERTLAALFYAMGRNDLERANISNLLREAVNAGWIDQVEFDALDRARKIRNPITHFRRPGFNDTVEYRSIMENELPYTIIEEDAQHVMATAFQLLRKNAR